MGESQGNENNSWSDSTKYSQPGETVMMMAPMTILIRDKLINNCPFQRDTRGRLTLFSGGGGGIGC